MTRVITDSDKEFIKLNYPSNGARYCAEKLNKPDKWKTIQSWASKQGIKVNPGVHQQNLKKYHKKYIKTNEEYSVNPEQFFDITSEYIVYLLGFLWADGYIYNKGYYQYIRLEILNKDFQYIRPILLKTGSWSESHRRRISGKLLTSASISNKPLVEFLQKNDYLVKSNQSADSILSLIPDHLKRYWFLGLIDGDGCFYVNQEKSLYQFSIASSYNQNWTYFLSLLDKLNIKTKVSQKIDKSKPNKTFHSSYVRITSIKDINKLINFLYPNGYEFGFKRKYEKAMIIANKANDVHGKLLV